MADLHVCLFVKVGSMYSEYCTQGFSLLRVLACRDTPPGCTGDDNDCHGVDPNTPDAGSTINAPDGELMTGM